MEMTPGVQAGHLSPGHQAHPPRTQWESGLCDCCDDPRTACLGCLCPPCLFGRTYGELHDTGCFGACCLYFCCPCLACCFAADVRKRIRDKYGLRPEPCNDCLLHAACSPCGLCQESHELRHRQRLEAYAAGVEQGQAGQMEAGQHVEPVRG